MKIQFERFNLHQHVLSTFLFEKCSSFCNLLMMKNSNSYLTVMCYLPCMCGIFCSRKECNKGLYLKKMIKMEFRNFFWKSLKKLSYFCYFKLKWLKKFENLFSDFQEISNHKKFVIKLTLVPFKRSHKLFIFSIKKYFHTLGLRSLWDKFARKFALLLETKLKSVQSSIALLVFSIFHKTLIKLLNLDLILGMTMWELKRDERRF